MGQANASLLSNADVKRIAVASMVADHIGSILVDCLVHIGVLESNVSVYAVSLLLHLFGRLAFPLFVFLLVEGFFHTSSRKAYLGRLAAFALVSEVPFDLAFSWQVDGASGVSWLSFGYQNVFFTLAIGFAVIWAMEVIICRYGRDMSFFCCCFCCFIVSIGCLSAWFVRSDYSFLGILSISAMYLARKLDVAEIGLPLSVLPLLAISRIELAAFADILIVSRYDGTLGEHRSRWFFYWFYPLHLLVLTCMRTIVSIFA